jgi:hypothetical protein
VKKRYVIIASFLLLCVLSNVIIHNIFDLNYKISTDKYVFAHSFPQNNYAKLLASLDQFQTESNLVKENLISNDTAMAQKHANEANSIFYWDLLVEIVKQDKQVGDELKLAVGDLLNLTNSISNNTSTSSLELQQINQKVDKITTNINSNTYKIINNTAALKQSEDSNFLNIITGFFSDLFSGSKNDNSNSNDASIHPIRFAELVDNVLRNYGDAYAVNFDMTDMANMAMTNNGSDKINHTMMNMSSSTNDQGSNAGKSESIINMANYQSAMGMANKLLDIFNKELNPIITSKNESSVFSNSLEKGINQLINSIEDKAEPMEIMMIVHTQIHPSLAEAFNLQILSAS